MQDDVYFDCPECGHALVVGVTMAGSLVECPDCGGEIRVPEVREGVNPRDREEVERELESTREAVRACADQVEGIGERLNSLSRRMDTQRNQVVHLLASAELVRQRISRLRPGASKGGAVSEGASDSVKWAWISLGLSILTMLAVLVALWR